MQLQEAVKKLILRLSMPMQEAMSVLAVMIYVATCGNELRILITFFFGQVVAEIDSDDSNKHICTEDIPVDEVSGCLCETI